VVGDKPFQLLFTMVASSFSYEIGKDRLLHIGGILDINFVGAPTDTNAVQKRDMSVFVLGSVAAVEHYYQDPCLFDYLNFNDKLVRLGRVVRKVRQHPDDHEFESQQWQ
jgi:hypothetical protein